MKIEVQQYSVYEIVETNIDKIDNDFYSEWQEDIKQEVKGVR